MRGSICAPRLWLAKAVLFCLCALLVCAADAAGRGDAGALDEQAGMERLLREKARLLVEKAQKAERAGEYAEAVEAYEDAYEAFPGNVTPLLGWGDLLCRLGQFDHSRAVLKRIPFDQLPPAGQVRVNMLFARIAVAQGNLERAALLYSEILKTQPANAGARVRLAHLNRLFGLENRKLELLRDRNGRELLSYRERVILFLLELDSLRLIDAADSAVLLSNSLAAFLKSSDGSGAWSVRLQTFPPINYLSAIPIGLAPDIGILYALILTGILIVMAVRLAPAASGLSSLVFALLVVLHVAGTGWFGLSEARTALLVDTFSIYDSVWIIPRLLIAMHAVTLAFFIGLPLLFLVPQRKRPRRSEVYAVWFFCWWLMTFVLIFQSRLDIMVRLPGMVASLACALLASFWMPLGRFMMFQAAKMTGLSRMLPAVSAGGEESFSDAKLHEAQAVIRLEEEEFEAVIITGKKLFALHDPASFPEMHLSMVRAYLEQEDIYECRKLLFEFQSRFADSRRATYGILMEALLKSVTADFAGALKTINAIPEWRAASLGGDDTALGLLVTGRCHAALENPHQAHQDWVRALEFAKLPLVRACVLAELALLDASENRRELTAKWAAAAKALGGGPKTAAYAHMVRSIDCFAADRREEALQAATEACRAFPRCGAASAWHGHLLCIAGRFAEAQTLLEKMTPGTAAGNRLMEEITNLG